MPSGFRIGPLLMILAVAWTSGELALAQPPAFSSLHDSNMPPGVVGQQQLLRSPTLPGYVQAVEILAPEGVRVAAVVDGGFGESKPAPVLLGMQIGFVYQLKVTNIPLHEGLEVYPTVELVNRLYPPEGTKLRFPVPIELTAEEIEWALDGQYVTRVIYLEDPDSALPQLDDPRHQRVIEVGPKEDPLHYADRLGRPLAILRMGSRVPDTDTLGGIGRFGSPPVHIYPTPASKSSVKPYPKQKPLPEAFERHGQDIPRLPENANRAGGKARLKTSD